MKRGVVLFLILILGFASFLSGCKQEDVIKIGYIGSITGSVAKYGTHEAVVLAVEDINNAGGINGKKIRLISEDARCTPGEAVNAINKLIYSDGVKIVKGGHCSPESLAIAPIIEDTKSIMLASATTSPLLSDKGDYVFRTSPVSTVQSGMIAELAYNELNLRKMAIIYEQTDYAEPIAEKLKEEFVKLGGEVVVYDAFMPGSTQFRTILTKVKNEEADGLFLSPQSPDAALNLIKQLKELDLNVKLFGNDVAGISANIDKIPDLYEEFIMASPDFDVENPKTKKFMESYEAKYGVPIPFGIWTAESYDGVIILKEAIESCGEDTDCIKEFLYNVKDFEGASGKITIDENGDGVREYALRIVKDGKMIAYS